MGLKWIRRRTRGGACGKSCRAEPARCALYRSAPVVIDLDEFDDNREGSNEAKLEAIQMAWHETIRNRTRTIRINVLNSVGVTTSY